MFSITMVAEFKMTCNPDNATLIAAIDSKSNNDIATRFNSAFENVPKRLKHFSFEVWFMSYVINKRQEKYADSIN